jgi:serine/threonine protein kinase
MPQSSTYQQLESLIKEFELHWQFSRPDIADFLPRYPENRLELLVELAHIDLELRYTQGERAKAREYLDRFVEYQNNPAAAVQLIRAEYDHLHRLCEASDWNTWSQQYADYREHLPVDLVTTSVFRSTTHKVIEIPQNYLPSIPGYELKEELGRGGMGIVYRAYHAELNRQVAIKTLRSGSLATASERERFQREAEAIAKLDHPNIVPIYRVGRWKLPGTEVEIPYFVMKFFSGGSLEGLRNRSPLEFETIAVLTVTMCDAVHHAHQRGILHRDLKPSNILLDETGTPHVADLGLASRLDEDNPSQSSEAIVGTPAYMAPEQLTQPKQVTTAADVYGLGAILYQLLTRQAPFINDSSIRLLNDMLETPPQRPKKLRADVPTDLETICLKCLEKEPTRRYGSARELADDLQRWRTGYPIHARTITVIGKTYRLARRHPFFTGLLVLMCLMVGFGLISLTLSNQALTEQERQTSLALSAAKTLNQELRDALNREQQQLYVERIGSAGRLWESNQLTQAWKHLDDCPPALRNWEWNYLDRVRRNGPQRMLGHQDAVSTCQFLDDSRFITADNRDVLCLWQVGNSKPIATWRDPSIRQIKSVTSLAAHPTAHWAATADADSITIWDTSKRQVIQKLEGKLWVSISPDGSMLASTFENQLRLWDTSTWKLIKILKGHQQTVLQGRFTPDGKYLLTSSIDRAIKRWNVATGDLASELSRPIPTSSFAIAQQGRTVVEAFNGFLQLVDITTGQMIRRLEIPLTMRTPIAVHPDGEQIAIATSQSEIRCLHLSQPGRSYTLRGHSLPIVGLAFSPDGQQLISVGSDPAVHYWNLNNISGVRYSLEAGYQRILISPGKYLGIVQVQNTSNPQRLRLLDFATTKPVAEVPATMPAEFNHDGRSILASTSEGLILTEVSSGKTIRQWKLNDSQPRVIATNRATGQFAVGTFEGTVLLLDTEKEGVLHQWNPGLGPILSLTYNSTGDQLAINGALFTALWDLKTQEETMRLKMRHNTIKVQIDPQQHWLFTLDNDRSIRRHDIKTGQMIDVVASSASRISDFAIHPTAPRLATRSIDGMIKIWHLDFGQELLKLQGEEYPFGTIIWDADGNILYSTDRSLRTWSSK